LCARTGGGGEQVRAAGPQDPGQQGRGQGRGGAQAHLPSHQVQRHRLPSVLHLLRSGLYTSSHRKKQAIEINMVVTQSKEFIVLEGPLS
jgi:hypothetical protein